MTKTHGDFLLSLGLFYLLAFPAFVIYQSACLAIMSVLSFIIDKLGNLLDLSTDGAYLGWNLNILSIFRLPSPTARLQISHLVHPFGTWTLKLPMQVVYAVAAEFIFQLSHIPGLLFQSRIIHPPLQIQSVDMA